jgi:LPXTG-site transpeptidase (sortase) family protein
MQRDLTEKRGTMKQALRNFSLLTVVVIGTCIFFTSPMIAGEPAPGATIAIPRLGIWAPVVEAPLEVKIRTWDVSHLGITRVGHLQHTAWLGEPGNIALAAHSEVGQSLGVFAQLDLLDVGDEILLTQEDRVWRYQVVQVQTVYFTDMSSLYPNLGDRLTLITCLPNTYNPAIHDYDQHTVVIAQPVGESP